MWCGKAISPACPDEPRPGVCSPSPGMELGEPFQGGYSPCNLFILQRTQGPRVHSETAGCGQNFSLHDHSTCSPSLSLGERHAGVDSSWGQFHQWMERHEGGAGRGGGEGGGGGAKMLTQQERV